jgi:hypothetical protein
MDITLNFVFQLVAGLYMFVFVSWILWFLWIKSEVKLMQEALALTIASDPELAKKVSNIIRENKERIKRKKEEKV